MAILPLGLLSALSQKYLDLLARPLQNLGEKPQRTRRQPIHEVLVHEAPEQLELCALVPHPERPLECLDIHTYEPRLTQHRREAPRTRGIEPRLARRFNKQLGPAHERGRRGRDACVHAADGERDLLALEVAAGAEVGVGLGEEARPVFDGCDHGARVDVVEGAAEEPVFLAVIDEEFDVWRHGFGLDGA